MRRFAELLIFCVFIASMPSLLQAADLKVRVIDPDGKPVDDAKVTWVYENKLPVVGGGSTYTFTRKGFAHFPDVHVGNHQIRVEKPGYLPVQVAQIPVDGHVPPRRVVDEVMVVLNPVKQ
ncbi:MAG: carboxypeptidase-like regulatory domain-containing protein [Thermoanaerobaculia bacterium]